MRLFLRLFLTLFLVGSLVGGFFLYFVYHIDRERLLEKVRLREQSVVNLQHNVVYTTFSSIVGDVRFLTEENEFAELEHAVGQEQYRNIAKTIEKEYSALLKFKRNYDQVRFVDQYGMELIRVNFNNGNPQAVPDQFLQDKSQRYYFSQSIRMRREEVYISPLDLNIENQVVEKPYKPTIRLSSPVYTADGNVLGVVIINYLAQHLLDRLVAAGASTASEKMVVNADGYWMSDPDAERCWGNVLPERQQYNFAFSFPKEWDIIQKASRGQFETQNGLFTFMRLYPRNEILHDVSQPNTFQGDIERNKYVGDSAQADCWYIINRFSPQAIKSVFILQYSNYFLFSLVFVLLTGSAALFLSMYIVRRRMDQEKLLTMALYDNLTSLPNRTLFFDRLTLAIQSAVRNRNKVGLLYIDLDGFKAVNDSMGHHAGDELLVRVAQRFKESVRKSDTVARMGGDEFAVILPAIDGPQDARLVGEKILASLTATIELSTGSARVGASVGGVVYPDHATDAETLVQLGDKAMYSAKQQRNRVCLLSEC